MDDTVTSTTTDVKIKYPSMWRVILHNDDYTPMDFVVQVLINVFSKSIEEAVDLMLTVHNKGRAQVALYTKEIAETKVAEVMNLAQAFGHPLLATIEEA